VERLVKDIAEHGWARSYPFSEMVWLDLVNSVALRCSTKDPEPISMRQCVAMANTTDPILQTCVAFFREARATGDRLELIQKLTSPNVFSFVAEVAQEGYANACVPV
jgi:hypothetical protein